MHPIFLKNAELTAANADLTPPESAESLRWNRRSRHLRANLQKRHFARNRRLSLSNFDRGFVRNPALAWGSWSRQKTGEMPHFCLPNSPKTGRATLKVEQNPQKLRKCSTAASKSGPRGLESRTKSPKIGKMFYRRPQIRSARLQK